MNTALTHIALHVRDFEAWIAFYGSYCGVGDPNGKIVEFSYGQPLGPGARQ